MIPRLNCGSSCLPGGLRECDMPGDEETAEQEECLGCGERECACGEDYCDLCGEDFEECECEDRCDFCHLTLTSCECDWDDFDELE